MRLLSVLLIVISACINACDRTARSTQAPRQRPSEPASAAKSVMTNSTGFLARQMESPLAALDLRFSTPEFGEQIAVAAPRIYEVRLELGASEIVPSSVEVALDAGRPRRLFPPQTTIALGQLLAPGEELGLGEHWLFAAPVLASGLVPIADTNRPRLAIARRFSIGTEPGSGSKGVVWVRKPEGTYNGRERAGLVLFDSYAFTADGAASNLTPAMSLRGPGLQGELRMPCPFALAEVASGDYEVRASAPGLAEVSARFTINRELGVDP